MLSTSFPSMKNPAGGIFVARLARAIAQYADVTLVTPCADSEAVPDATYRVTCFRYAPRRWQLLAHQPGGLPVALRSHRWLLLLLPGFLLCMLFACLRAARRCDVLHANWSLSGAFAGLAGRLCGTPVLTTLRGSDVSSLERAWSKRALLRLCLLTNQRIVCVSDALSSRLREFAPRFAGKLSVIPNGVGDEFLSIKRALRPCADRLHIVSIGSITVNKNMTALLAALQIAAGACHARLTIVGDGPQREALRERLDAQNLEGRVRLAGALPPEEIPEIMAAADIFVLASRSEGRPNVVIEAMAAGLPVVASNIPGIAELVTHDSDGLLFDPDDAHTLAEHLMRLERDAPLRQRLGQAGRRTVQERGLTWSRAAQSYLALYADFELKG